MAALSVGAVLALPGVEARLDDQGHQRFDAAAGVHGDVHAQVVGGLGDLLILGQEQLPEGVGREKRADLGAHVVMEQNHVGVVILLGNLDQFDVPFGQLVVERRQLLRLLQQVAERILKAGQVRQPLEKAVDDDEIGETVLGNAALVVVLIVLLPVDFAQVGERQFLPPVGQIGQEPGCRA